ncbi:hypothetical protein BKA67DRAFT_535052 [Truncatella angustata]|uniref:Uncharacterized protein n=1 Tax=Truncatella angustata TaxID=152316 RepID=A0A9P8UQ33_9PEZI|nr:uncharacterized protein BKA67DRAFT_535052 [Truncatella angustata]KAH6656158.1 hypothetical protein BKA67DRAFT_535052 [Truncatella angustata]KAH8194094.1 hypothetical protein TruAng_011744 [Truncatella angustata]
MALRDLSGQNLGSIVLKNFLVLLSVEQPQFMQMAVVEAAIADALMSRIFRPHYALDLVETAQLLVHLNRQDSRREALRIVEFLFGTKTETTIKFYEGLVVIFRRGIEIWRVVQRSCLRPGVFGVLDNDTDWNEDTDKLGDYDSLVDLEPEQEVFRPEIVDPLLALFPRTCLGEEIMHRGFALWPDQNAVVTTHISSQGLGKRTH